MALVLTLFAFSGCGKEAVKADTDVIKSKAQYVMTLFQSAGVESLESFREAPEFQQESTVASLGGADASGNMVDLSDTKTEDFMGMVDAWIAANNELGDFESIDMEPEIEEKGSTTTATFKAKFKDRDADVILSFETEDSVLKNMTVNGDYARSEVLKKAGLNTILGMGTVFVVLIIIMCVISLFKFLPGVNTGKKKAPAAAAPAEAPAAVKAAPAADSTEIQAVIAAAIAAYAEESGQDTSGYFVRKIVRKHR